MTPSIADVTGPHPRDEAITFSWARAWVPAMGAVLALALTAAAGWYSLRAEAQEAKAEARATVRRVEAVEKRAEAQEQAQRQLEVKLTELDRKLTLVVCKLIPGSPGCP